MDNAGIAQGVRNTYLPRFASDPVVKLSLVFIPLAFRAIRRIKMRARTVCGQRSWPGMQTGLTFAGTKPI